MKTVKSLFAIAAVLILSETMHGREVFDTLLNGESVKAQELVGKGTDLKQQNFPELKGPYIGQDPPGMKSEIFAPGIVSTGFGELNAVFTGDGNEFYFSRRGVPGKKSEIMVASKVNSAGSEYGSALSPDGNYFFYSSNKAGTEDVCWISADVIRKLKKKRGKRPEDVCSVTYIANDGFLVATKNKKILADALFGGIKGNWCDQPGDSVSNLMLKGIAPFDDIHVVLVSHRHADHFNARMIIDFLRNNPGAILVCPAQVEDLLKTAAGYADITSRLKAIRSQDHPDTTVIVNGLTIRAMRLRHGSWMETDSLTGKRVDLHEGVENLGYLIESDSCRILHTGDASVTAKSQFEVLDLSAGELDVAFFDRTFLRPEGLNIIRDNILTKNLVLMHLEPARKEYYTQYIKNIPGLTVYTKQLDKRVITR